MSNIAVHGSPVADRKGLLVQAAAKPDGLLPAELSFAEELMWQAEVGGPGALPFFDCARSLWLVLDLAGPLNEEALRRSLEAVIRRHDVLRSRFVARNGQPERLISQTSSLSFTHIDRQKHSSEDSHEIIENEIKPQLESQCDLEHGPLMRASLVRLSNHEHILAIAVHHIVFDRWSKRLLELELKEFYRAYVTDTESGIRTPQVQYQDYVLRQREQLNSDRAHHLSNYWTSKLCGLPDLVLPYADNRAGATATRSSTVRFTIPAEEVSRLVALSRQSRTTLAATMLAVFTLFLYKISSMDDFAVGVPLSDRRRPELEEAMGLFMNVVVVRTSIPNGMTFLDLLDRVRRNLVDACIHQDLPYGYLQRIMAVRPLYKVVFNFLPAMPGADIQLAGLQTKCLPVSVELQSRADLSFHLWYDAGTLECRLIYKAALFPESRGQNFATQIQTLTKAILQTPHNCLDTYCLQ